MVTICQACDIHGARTLGMILAEARSPICVQCFYLTYVHREGFCPIVLWEGVLFSTVLWDSFGLRFDDELNKALSCDPKVSGYLTRL
jgi:hypothetical protein